MGATGSAEADSTVDFCPKRDPAPGMLTKCCLQEEHVEAGEGWVSVPWGSSFEQVGRR
jgi:hypothetical protein